MVAEPVTLTATASIHRPVMTQRWLNLTYVHWRYDPAVVQALLPKGYVVDTYDGSAWVGLIPFAMHDITFPLTKRLSIKTGRFGTFPETNVRTYIVDGKGRRGVWFFSLDINRIAPTAIARVGYGLPYCFASMHIETNVLDEVTTVRYESRRRWPRTKAAASSNVWVAVGKRINDTDAADFDAWSSARWALGSRFCGLNLWARVEHPQWELFEARLIECDESVIAAAGLPTPVGDPVVRWSPGVSVRIQRPSISRRETTAGGVQAT
jgi:uncharacterized protein